MTNGPYDPATNTPRRRFSGLGILSFLFLWLLIGFTVGTFVLVAPVRWLVAGVHRAGGSPGTERVAVITLVIAYIVVSFILALRLNGYLWRTPSRAIRFGIPAALTVLTLLTAWEWQNPSALLSGAAGGGDGGTVQSASGATFEFGAYPDEARLRELKREGITTVVSLQHPNDLVEREGIEEEADAIKTVGLKLIQAPMLPWFSDNKEALDTLRALAMHGRGKFYVHCGLGRDRVNIAKKLIEGLGAKTLVTKGFIVGLGFEERSRPFIHGTLLHLATGVWLTPYPEHEETFGCLVEGRAGNIVLIFDTTDVEQKRRLSDVSSILRGYGIGYSLLPVGVNGAGATFAADSVHRLPLPVTIVASETPWADGLPRKGAENALAFRAAYARERPDRSLNGNYVKTGYVVPTPQVGAQDKFKGC